MIEWMKKNRKELLLPFLCFVLGLLLAIANIQVQEQGTDTKEDQTLTHFQPKDYKNLVSKEQEIKQFKWTIEAVAKFESSSQAESATRNPLGNNCDGMGKSPKS